MKYYEVTYQILVDGEYEKRLGIHFEGCPQIQHMPHGPKIVKEPLHFKAI